MTDLDPRTAPWRALATFRLLLTQLATDWENTQAWPRPCPDCDGESAGGAFLCYECESTGLTGPSPYDEGARDAYHPAAAELRDLPEGPR